MAFTTFIILMFFHTFIRENVSPSLCGHACEQLPPQSVIKFSKAKKHL